jgi:hypothetical protein
MAQTHYRAPFKKALLQFITEPGPYLSMLKWVMTEMMKIEAEAKVGAPKGQHSTERATYFSGARVCIFAKDQLRTGTGLRAGR